MIPNYKRYYTKWQHKVFGRQPALSITTLLAAGSIEYKQS
jgi:hypothetical protein